MSWFFTSKGTLCASSSPWGVTTLTVTWVPTGIFPEVVFQQVLGVVVSRFPSAYTR